MYQPDPAIISEECGLPPLAVPDPEYNNKEYENHLMTRYCKNSGCASAPDTYYPYKNAVVEIFIVNPGLVPEAPLLSTTLNGIIIKCGECFYVVSVGTTFQNYINNNLTNPIYAVVTNANNTTCTLLYELDVHVYDPFLTMIVFKFREFSNLNNRNGRIKCHPYLEWGSSRKTPVGSPVYFMWNADGYQLIDKATLRHNHYNEDQPYWELLQTDTAGNVQSVGSPVMDNFHKFIGIVSNNGIISEYMFRHTLIAAVGGKRGLDGGHLIATQAGVKYWRYQQGYLGLQLAFPPSSAFVTDPNGCNCKIPVVGMQVVAVNPTGSVFNLPPGNTIITKINGSPIGKIPPAITPGALTHRTAPTFPVTISFRFYSEGLIDEHCLNGYLLPPDDAANLGDNTYI